MTQHVLLAWFNMELPAQVMLILRIGIGVVGALVGWFITGPVARLLFRLVFRKSAPIGLIPVVRLGGAGALGAASFFFLSFGGGGGWGPFGLGPGKGPGEGPGTGMNVSSNDGKTAQDPSKGKSTSKFDREKVDIELVNGPPGEKRYYLRRDQKQPQSLDEIKSYLQEKKAQLEVCIVQTNESPGDPALLKQLRVLLDRHNIPNTIRDEMEK